MKDERNITPIKTANPSRSRRASDLLIGFTYHSVLSSETFLFKKIKRYFCRKSLLLRDGSLKDSHYLEYGSELFQCIAKRLGDWATQKMLNQGTPTLIQCSLPITWLNEFTTFPMLHSYALAPLVQLILRIRKPEERFPICGAFMLKRSVPSEFILDTIDMTSLLKENEKI